MSANKLVSVVIPTYNRQALVVEAVESALAQSYAHLEVIVVDDGSTDGTEEAMRPYQERIRYFKQPNQSCAAARNKAIREATGEYVALLDSDDLWAPTKIEKQVQLMERGPEMGAVYCQATCIHVKTGMTCALPYDAGVRGDVRRKLLRGNYITGSASSVMVRRACFDEVGLFNETLRSAEDWEMWIRVSRRFPFDSVPESLVTYRVHGCNKSKRIGAMYAHQLRIVDAAFCDDPINRENSKLRRQILAFYHWNAGVEHLWAGDYPSSLRCLTKSLAAWPLGRREMAFLYRAPRSHLIAALRRRAQQSPLAAAAT
jgi:glycosyltransferase involved in cell wall biosynthesis